jgi:hypothetical protein
MSDLENSARKLLRATYVPFKPEPGKPSRGKRAWEKRAIVAGLAITDDELDRLAQHPGSGLKSTKAIQAALRAIQTTVHGNGATSAPENAIRFADVEWSALSLIVKALVTLREHDLKTFQDTHAAILRAYTKNQTAARKGQGRNSTRGTLAMVENSLEAPSPTPASGLQMALEWGQQHSIRTKEARGMLNLLRQLFAEPALVTKASFQQLSVVRIHAAQTSLAAIKQYAATEPIGLLHLERLTFTPAGIERGELIHSVPLSPGEEVNISHKEWANTSEEFSKIVTDSFEAYSEEGVAEKSELAHSTSSQEQHSSGFNTGVTASGGYGPVSITSSVSFSMADSASTSEQTARTHSMSTTRKASARSKKEHKVSFKVASAAGTEDQQVQKIKNPFPDKATRLDYYQLVRKWRVDLHRYGVRLTYDITIPEPGSGILSKIQEVQDIADVLQQGFGDATSKSSWASFDLTPNQITRDNYITKAADYGAAVPKPPPEFKWYDTSAQHQWKTYDEAERSQFFTLEVEVDEDYEIDDVVVPPKHNSTKYEGKKNFLGFQNMDDFYGKSGKRILVYQAYGLGSLYVELQVRAKLRDAAYNDWKLKAWNAMRDAALARYEANRENLKQRMASLLEELGAQDPLSLRKIEREEVMKGVLRWLFGPEFEFTPSVPAYMPSLPAYMLSTEFPEFSKDNPLAQVVLAVWVESVRSQEEIIKFLHHAIEWENMLYFLYPYFWSHPSRWELKKYLNHPDLLHRVFLKSGSARVVLTIRPGFEKAFVSLLDTGKLDSDHPYLTIAEEMEAYAKTNYPGVRPANPVEDARPLLSYKQRRAWKEMQSIIALLEAFKTAEGDYPTTAEGLAALASIGEVPAQDPWGNPYVYTSPGLSSDFELASYGADGVEGGEEDAADITSWAEASLIGRWYEYTPTSALDIAFGETQPSA